jgi:hypothetical protein
MKSRLHQKLKIISLQRGKPNLVQVTHARHDRGHILEFVITLGIFLLLIFPFLNLLTIATSYATICLLTQQCVSQAAKQHTYQEALKVASNESQSWLNSPFASFAKLSAVSGYRNSGIDLYVEATDFRTTKVTSFGPNKPIPSPLDPQTFVYELAAASSFEVKPFVDMSKIPVLGGIAGLGQPITLNYRCAKAAEHIAGLDDDSPITTAYTGGAMTFNAPKLQTEGATTSQANVGSWNHPDMYESIKNAGQKVLAQDVIIVHANNSYWTPTNLEVPEGASIWIDYRADGEWTTRPEYGVCDADGTWRVTPDTTVKGQNGECYGGVQVTPGLYDGMMLGRLGLKGPVLHLGKQQWCKKLTGSGKLFLGAFDADGVPLTHDFGGAHDSDIYGWNASLVNEGFPAEPAYANNKGTMEVRIVIAK